MDKLNIALPKGRLADEICLLLEKAGLSAPGLTEDSRKLIFDREDLGLRFFLAKPWDVPVYVERGAADIGICGRDTIVELGANVYELADLGYGKCRIVVAGPKDFQEDGARTLRVATKFPNIARNHYNGKNLNAEIIRLNGSIELAPLMGLSNVIVDIVQSGSTLKENGLAVIEEIMPVSARLIACKASYKYKAAAIDRIARALKGETI